MITHKEIKSYITLMMLENGYKKDDDYIVTKEALYIRGKAVSNKHKIKKALQSAFPEIIFAWDEGHKLFWIL